MKISWIGAPDRIKYELMQLSEEGKDTAALTAEWKSISENAASQEELEKKAETFYARLCSMYKDAGGPEGEPSEWEEITSHMGDVKEEVPALSSDFITDRILGGWLGRSAGCLLGKPVEKTPRSGIKELLESNGTWPLKDYVSGIGIPQELLQKYPWNRHSGKESLKENIECMTEDDDMNYPMLNLYAAETYGELMTTEDILQSWLDMMPVLTTFTAERIAYVNTLNGLRPPETAKYCNPYREWIGAQIRADLWGWISPMQPMRAAYAAWKDARLSHTGNGIYGEMFFSAALALAFRHDDMNEIVRGALRFIPPASRFYKAIDFVVSLGAEKMEWEQVLDILYKEFGKYHWVHTINNAALVTAALLSSGGDFEKAVCNTVMGGWDTDSNGATAGSVIGTMLGAKGLPEKWTAPLKDKIRSSLKGFDNQPLSNLAQRTAALAKYKIKKEG